MVIRHAQMEAFEQAAVETFLTRTYRHLEEWFPHHCQLLGQDQMRLVIRYGWEKASSYGFTAECCVRSYIEFMCLLGGGFDKDVVLPWASEILNDTSSSDQVARADRLYYRMWEYIDHIAHDYRDPEGRPTTARFMSDLKELRHADEESPGPDAMQEFLNLIELRMKRLFPAKFSYVGAERVRRAVAESVQSANRYGITSKRGATLFTGMRFVLGGGFDEDLLLPWASAALTDRKTHDQYKRVDRLYADGVAFLRRWWDLSSASGDQRNVLG